MHMSQQTDFEKELAALIVETVKLEDVSPEEIEPAEALVVEGLGLDSIDALDIAMAVSKKYGVPLKPDDPNNRQIFESLRSLAQYIEQNRTK